MGAQDSTPTNLNMQNSSYFEFNVQRLPYTSFFVQKVNIPGLTLPSIKIPTPLVPFKEPGDSINYNIFSIQFKVDEELKNWLELYDWIKGDGFPNTNDEYAALEAQPVSSGRGVKSNISLFTLNSYRTPTVEITMTDAFPVFLSDLQFDTTLGDLQYLTAMATFEYTVLEFKRLTST